MLCCIFFDSLDESFICIQRSKSTACFLCTNFVSNLFLDSVLFTNLLTVLDQLYCSAEYDINVNNFTHLIRVFCRINMKQIESVQDIFFIRFFCKLHCFIFRKMIISFFISLPWAAMVSAEVIYVIIINFFANGFYLFTEQFLVTVEYISTAKFVRIHLVTTCDIHQWEIFFLRDLKRCSEEILGHWTDTQHGISFFLCINDKLYCFSNTYIFLHDIDSFFLII